MHCKLLHLHHHHLAVLTLTVFFPAYMCSIASGICSKPYARSPLHQPLVYSPTTQHQTVSCGEAG